MVSDKFRCRLQLVNVVDGVVGGQAIGQELSRLTMMVSVFWFWTMSTSGMSHSLLSVSRHPPKMASLVGDDGFIGIVDVDGVLVEHCDVVGICVLSCVSSEC